MVIYLFPQQTVIQQRKFDKKNTQTYNCSSHFKSSNGDSFVRTKKSTDMENKLNQQQLINALKTAKNLSLSPVAYIVPLIESFMDSAISVDELFEIMTKETKQAQFIFSKMPREEIKANQSIFRKEFEFADDVYDAISSEKESAKLKIRLQDLIYKNFS